MSCASAEVFVVAKSYSHHVEGVDVAASAVHDDGSETDVENLGPEERGAEFFEFLVNPKMHCKLKAKDVCILSYCARGAGVYEDLAKESLKLQGSRSGCVTTSLEEIGASQDEKHPVVPTSWATRSSPRALRRRRAIPTHGCGHWLLARQPADGSCSSRCGRRTCVGVGAKVGAISTPSGHTPIGWSMRSTRAATRDNGTPWNPGKRVTDSENKQGLTWYSWRNDLGQGRLG